MLNEVAEYEQYTYSFEKKDVKPRLNHSTICNSLGGTARAFTTIARKTLYSGGESLISDVNVGVIDKTKSTLEAWCGDPVVSYATAPSGIEYGWLPNYIIRVLLPPKIEEYKEYLKVNKGLEKVSGYNELLSNCQTVFEKLNFENFRDQETRNMIVDLGINVIVEECDDCGKKAGLKAKLRTSYASIKNIIKTLGDLSQRYDQYRRKMYSKRQHSKNDFNLITYDKIIADAIAAGPLKQYYLVCEQLVLEEVLYNTGKKITRPFKCSPKKKKPTETDNNKKDMLLKTVAAYLLEQYARGAGKYYKGFAPVNKTDIANWLHNSDKPDKISDELKKYTIEGRPLVSWEAQGNTAYLSFDTQWMEQCGWDIVSRENLDSFLEKHPNALFFSDPGAGMYLNMGIRYL